MPIKRPTLNAKRVFGNAEASKVAEEVRIELETEISAPLTFNCGQVIKLIMIPIKHIVQPVQCSAFLCKEIVAFPLTAKAQINSDATPEKKNACMPAPPSKIFNPDIRIAEFSVYPIVMIGAIKRYICQYPNIPMQSRQIMSTASWQNTDLTNNLISIENQVLNPLKQLSQKVEKSTQVSKVMAEVMMRTTRECNVSFLQGMYMRVKPSRKVISVRKYEEELESAVVDLPNAPMKMTARSWVIITTTENIYYL